VRVRAIQAEQRAMRWRYSSPGGEDRGLYFGKIVDRVLGCSYHEQHGSDEHSNDEYSDEKHWKR
jgi:hypothetical protein